MSRSDVGPHRFERLLRFRNKGRCRACYLPESDHPIHAWVPARPMGDTEPAASTYENWTGRTGSDLPEEAA